MSIFLSVAGHSQTPQMWELVVCGESIRSDNDKINTKRQAVVNICTNAIQFYLYSANSEQLLRQGALYCKIKSQC